MMGSDISDSSGVVLSSGVAVCLCILVCQSV